MLLKAIFTTGYKTHCLGRGFYRLFLLLGDLPSAGQANLGARSEGLWEPAGRVKVNFKARAGVLAALCHWAVVWRTRPNLSSQDTRRGALRSEEINAHFSSPHPALTHSFTPSHTFIPQAPLGTLPQCPGLIHQKQ